MLINVMNEIEKEVGDRKFLILPLSDALLVIDSSSKVELEKFRKFIQKQFDNFERTLSFDESDLSNAICLSCQNKKAKTDYRIFIVTEDAIVLQNYFAKLLNNRSLEKWGQKSVSKIWTNGKLVYTTLDQDSEREY